MNGQRRTVAILIPGSRNESFYSQIAATARAIARLPWRRWTPCIHAFLGGEDPREPDDAFARWAPFLKQVSVTVISAELFQLKDNWAQVDAALELAPRDADVLLSLDADTLPVAPFEDVLDTVADHDLVAGVMAHYPPPPAIDPRAEWLGAAEGLMAAPLEFDHAYSLVSPDAPDEQRRAPFYMNGGVMFFSRTSFDRFLPLYLRFRATLAQRLAAEAFAGQVAATFAIVEAGLRTAALPLRYNFPNDALAARLHPQEAMNVVIYHYLRTRYFDRHRIFASPAEYDQFLALTLSGPDRAFQDAVRRIVGHEYPFERAAG